MTNAGVHANPSVAAAGRDFSMRKIHINFSALWLAIVVATGSISKADDSEEFSIHNTYIEWVEATNDKDLERWSAFLADDPYFTPANSPPLVGTDEVVSYYERSFADPRFSLDCEQEHVEVSESGRIAWSRGNCNATFTGSDGEKARGTSRWFKVWIKQSNGSWRCRVNSWRNVD